MKLILCLVLRKDVNARTTPALEGLPSFLQDLSSLASFQTLVTKSAITLDD